MKKNLLLTLCLLICIASFFFSCDDNDNADGYPKDIVYELDEDTLLFPYTGYDTLVFLIDTGNEPDTTTFIGLGKIHYEHYIGEEYGGNQIAIVAIEGDEIFQKDIIRNIFQKVIILIFKELFQNLLRTL